MRFQQRYRQQDGATVGASPGSVPVERRLAAPPAAPPPVPGGSARRAPSLPPGAAEGADAAVASLRQAFASATRAAERLRRRAQGVLTAVALIAVSLAFGVVPASSSPTSQFEMEGDIVDDAAVPAPDWGSIFGRDPAGVDGAPVVVKSAQGLTSPTFVEDLMASDALPSPPCSPGKKGDLTVLSGAGSDKNGDALSTWTYESGSIPPNKDDITNLYGAAKVDTDGHRLVYWGLERSNNNGTGHLDVEFLQAPMGANPTGTDAFGCPKGSFLGSRTVGDVLLVLDLSKGGSLGLQEIRVWDGDSYEIPAVDIGAVAGIWHNEAGPIACGDWNCREPAPGGPVYVDTLDTNTFVEGFVDATGLGIAGCFSSFNAKSRSSQEWNSELKDIAFGELNTCDARISITPDGVNQVGDPHTFTGHVETNASGTFASAPAGTQIDFAIVSGPGSFAGPSSCLTVGSTGSCSVSVTSSVSGTTVVSASTAVQVGPVTVRRSTNGDAGDGGSGNATKHWADGYIKVTPTAVNPVNEPHVFTVELGVLDGGADTVTLGSITPTVAPAPDGGVTSTCADPVRQGDDDIWRCTVTINSSVAGVFTATATGTATVSQTGIPGTVTITRTTVAGQHGPGGNEGAVKTYVDARISVGPDGLNAVDDPHTFTATVETRDGDGAWTPAPAGTTVTFSATGAGGFVGAGDCATGAGGTCSVSVVSSTAGTTEVGASATVTVNGVELTRTTGTAVNAAAGGSGDALKRWVDASITVVETAVNEVGDDHVFDITVTAHRPSDETVAFTSITPTASPAPGSSASTCDLPTVAADGLSATCTFTINSATPGIFDVDATAVVTFTDGDLQATVTRSTGPAADADPGPAGNSGSTKTFVDARVSVGLDGVNAVGDPHTVTGTAEYDDGTGWQPAVGRTITFATTQGPGTFVGASTCVAGPDGTCSVEIVSATPGVQWVSAATSYPVLGVTLNRTTAVDGPTDPDNLRKEWVAATIAITPTAVNEVGVPHAFAITVTASATEAPVSFGPVSTTVTPAPGSQSDDCGEATPTAVDGIHTLACTLTINNPVAGVFTANTSSTVTIGGVELTVATDGTGGGGAAVKTYVDARISLSPDGVNEVGDPHPMTAHLEVDDGSGWADAAAGVTIAVDLLSGPGSLSAPSCTTGATGRCTVTLTSGVAGVSIVAASATVGVGGEELARSTNANAGPGGSDNVTKRWVDGAVSISPTGVNPVGAAHTFTVTATAVPSGSGSPAFTIAPAVTPAPSALATTCGDPVVVGAVATCTVTVTSATPGVFTAHATVEITMGGLTVTRSTDAAVAPAGPGGSGPATKTYVGADIQVGVDGVNAVGDPHPVTGHVNVNPGTGTVNAPDGTVVSFAVVSGPGALSAPSCTTAGGTGSCTVTLTSGVAGVTVVGASSTVDVAGVVLDLATNGAGANSANLTKRWVDAFVTIAATATNPLNEPHTFTVTATGIPSGAAPVVFESITTSVAPAPPTMSDTCATPTVAGDTATCTLTINSDVAGQYVANATARLRIGGAAVTRSTDPAVAGAGPGGSGPAVKTYVPLAVLGEVLERPATLPRTGTPALALATWGSAAILVGTGLVLGSRRRRRLA